MGPVQETLTRTTLEPADLDVGLAGDTDVFDAAFRLVHDQYTWRGYMAPSPSRRRLSVHHALPTTKVFVARRDRVVGTVTLVGDSLFGLPMDDLYRQEISTLRAQGRRIAEVSALATAAESRRTGITVLLHLMRALITYAVKLAALDDLCITVNPRHVAFYRSCMRFETIGGERAYGKVNGAPAVALRLNLEVARAIEAAVHRGDEREPIYQFLCAQANQARVLTRLWENLASARFRRPQFIEFFGDGMLLSELPPAMRARVEGFFAPVAAERPCEVDVVRAATTHDDTRRPELRLAYA
jgi:hypothetical protein